MAKKPNGLRAKLNPSILIKNNGTKGILALDITQDKIYQLKGDVALMVFLLNQESYVPIEKIKKLLAARSTNFAKNRAQTTSIREALVYLKKIGMVEYGESA